MCKGVNLNRVQGFKQEVQCKECTELADTVGLPQKWKRHFAKVRQGLTFVHVTSCKEGSAHPTLGAACQLMKTGMQRIHA